MKSDCDLLIYIMCFFTELFKRKYKLYEDDASVKKPRQTLYYQQRRRNHTGSIVFANESDQLCYDEAVNGVHHHVCMEELQNNTEISVCNYQANDTEFPGCNNNIDDGNSSIQCDQDMFVFPECSYQVDNTEICDNETESDLSSSDCGLTSESERSTLSDESDADIDDDDELNKISEISNDYPEVKKISMAMMSYMSRHILTNEATKDLIELIKVIVPEHKQFKSLSLSAVQEVCGQCEIKVYDICEVCLFIFPDDSQIYRCSSQGCEG